MKKMRIIIGMILSIVVTFSNYAFAFDFETGDLKDLVPASSWAENEIKLARSEGLITQNTNGYFTMNITREQFAELVVNMTEKVIGYTIVPLSINTFVDTDNANILKAYTVGIVKGTSETVFSPTEDITREQIATMLYRAITYIEKEKTETYVKHVGGIDKFIDKDSVSTYAKQSVGVLASNGIMNGTSATTLSPKNTATIEQSILLIYRIYEIVKG